ncbi:hypothetical protein OAK97_01100 [bacterium]|nr:hypothetical protein [bacterium]MDG1891944.1 hypothetical protein [Verrucomicrobiota bacterium]
MRKRKKRVKVFLWMCVMACFSALLSSTAQDAALEIDNLRANYQTILDRNPFNLQPPPPPEPEAEEEPEEEDTPELDELKLKIAGVSAKDQFKRVWMAMTIPNPDPELPPVERFFSFTESEDEHHGVKVKEIGLDGNIEIEFFGKSHKLDFEEYRYQGPSSGKGKKSQKKSNSKAPTRVSARELIKRRAQEQQRSQSQKRSSTTRPSVSNTSSRAVGRTSPSNSSGALLRNAGTATSRATGVQRVTSGQAAPSRSSTPAFSRDEQILIMEAQQAIAEQEGRRLPPLPPLRR